MISGYIMAYPHTLKMFDSVDGAVNARTMTERGKHIEVWEVRQVRLIAPDPLPEQTPKGKRLDILEEDANVLGQHLDAEVDNPEPPEAGAA